LEELRDYINGITVGDTNSIYMFDQLFYATEYTFENLEEKEKIKEEFYLKVMEYLKIYPNNRYTTYILSKIYKWFMFVKFETIPGENMNLSYEWLKKSADLGNIKAMCSLGQHYVNLLGVYCNYATKIHNHWKLFEQPFWDLKHQHKFELDIIIKDLKECKIEPYDQLSQKQPQENSIEGYIKSQLCIMYINSAISLYDRVLLAIECDEREFYTIFGNKLIYDGASGLSITRTLKHLFNKDKDELVRRLVSENTCLGCGTVIEIHSNRQINFVTDFFFGCQNCVH